MPPAIVDRERSPHFADRSARDQIGLRVVTGIDVERYTADGLCYTSIQILNASISRRDLHAHRLAIVIEAQTTRYLILDVVVVKVQGRQGRVQLKSTGTPAEREGHS